MAVVSAIIKWTDNSFPDIIIKNEQGGKDGKSEQILRGRFQAKNSGIT